MRDFFIVAIYNFRDVVGKSFFKILTLIITLCIIIGVFLPDLILKKFENKVDNKYLIYVVDRNNYLFHDDISINKYMNSISEMLNGKFYFDLIEDNIDEKYLNEIFYNGDIDGYLIVKDSNNINLVTSQNLGEVKFVLDRYINNKHLKENFNIDGNKINVNYEIKSIDLNKNKIKYILEKQTLPIIFMFFMYIVFIIYGQFISVSVNLEKNTKIIEVFLTKIKLSNIILGKIFGIFIAAFLQLLYFILLLYSTISIMSSDKFPYIKSMVTFDFSFILKYIVYFSLGFLIYCFIFLFIGNFVNKTEDLSIMIVPPIMLISFGYLISILNLQFVNNFLINVVGYIPFITPFIFSNNTITIVEIIKIVIMIITLILIIFINLKSFQYIIRSKGKR